MRTKRTTIRVHPCRSAVSFCSLLAAQYSYGLLEGAAPGGRISGSVELVAGALRVTKNTAAVQVGNISRPGTSSAAKVGKKAQCHPRRLMRTAPTATSRRVSAGEMPPAANRGKPMIWIASARMATNQALRCCVELVLRRSNLRKSKFRKLDKKLDPGKSNFGIVKNALCSCFKDTQSGQIQSRNFGH
jgi:hypothetical protein